MYVRAWVQVCAFVCECVPMNACMSARVCVCAHVSPCVGVDVGVWVTEGQGERDSEIGWPGGWRPGLLGDSAAVWPSSACLCTGSAPPYAWWRTGWRKPGWCYGPPSARTRPGPVETSGPGNSAGLGYLQEEQREWDTEPADTLLHNRAWAMRINAQLHTFRLRYTIKFRHIYLIIEVLQQQGLRLHSAMFTLNILALASN